jgi:1-deoxy-D-xylulose-5-phosphate reductoisomerase
VVLNAANEVAVASFLEGRLGFTSIPVVIERTLNAHEAHSVIPGAPPEAGQESMELIRRADAWARERAGVLAGELQLMG